MWSEKHVICQLLHPCDDAAFKISSFFSSCFQNSRIQMSYFHTWILLTYQAIAMMTFFLFLRTTEAFCVLSPNTSHLFDKSVASRWGIPSHPFFTRTNSQLKQMVHTPYLTSSQNCLSQASSTAVGKSKRTVRWWPHRLPLYFTDRLCSCGNLTC